MTRTALLLLMMLTLAAPVRAQDAAPAAPATDEPASPDMTQFPVLAKLRGDDASLSYDYLGKTDGFDAWLLSGPGLMQTVYVLPNDHAFIGGALVGSDAKETGSRLLNDFMVRSPERARAILAQVRDKPADKTAPTAAPPEAPPAETPKTATVQVEVPPTPPATPAENLWRALGQTGYVSYGAKPGVAVIYAFLDPAQKASKDVWRELSPLARNDRVILHAIPLALTTGDSIMDIATVLGGDDPQVLWDKLMAGQSVQGGTPPNGDKILSIENTVKLAQELKLRDLPFLVYRVPVGNSPGKIRIIRGVPKDWAAFRAELSPTAPLRETSGAEKP